ncbi:hypothetical protein EVAR_63694_1 [Eumeta japonica]|uniref:Uncharacterized protein n=1 Tax=Eumeta variegata TaxID=151549 RepID=A0A4C1ZBU6_EUMVA|nr:hypothetical protein EVAR_63694_1 [Eumeta japonica]
MFNIGAGSEPQARPASELTAMTKVAVFKSGVNTTECLYIARVSNTDMCTWVVYLQMITNVIEILKEERMRGINDVREWCDLKEDVVTKVVKDMLRWFGYLETTNESRQNKSVQRMCEVKKSQGLP